MNDERFLNSNFLPFLIWVRILSYLVWQSKSFDFPFHYSSSLNVVFLSTIDAVCPPEFHSPNHSNQTKRSIVFDVIAIIAKGIRWFCATAARRCEKWIFDASFRWRSKCLLSLFFATSDEVDILITPFQQLSVNKNPTQTTFQTPQLNTYRATHLTIRLLRYTITVN